MEEIRRSHVIFPGPTSNRPESVDLEHLPPKKRKKRKKEKGGNADLDDLPYFPEYKPHF